MKVVYVPELIYSNEKNTIKYEGTPVCNIELKRLLLSGEGSVIEKINKFYGKLFEKYNSWIDTSLSKYVCNVYLDDKNPRKKYRFSHFNLMFDIKHEMLQKNIMRIEINIVLSRQGETVSRKKTVHMWNLKNGSLLIKRK